MGGSIPDFTEADRALVEAALRERYRRTVRVELAQAEAQPGPRSGEVLLCPAFDWEARGVEFLVVKLSAQRYRSLFSYSGSEHYGTGRDFDALAECGRTTLQLQADHERERAGAASGESRADRER